MLSNPTNESATIARPLSGELDLREAARAIIDAKSRFGAAPHAQPGAARAGIHSNFFGGGTHRTTSNGFTQGNTAAITNHLPRRTGT
ncbi:MAG: hypothetical protein ABI120_15855, partial [Gemmatimonadaceae bacterium]